jgi:zinc protease
MKRALLVMLLALVGPAGADAPKSEPKITYDKFELANGLEVYVIEDHKSPTVYEVLWFRVGSKDEVANRTGFAHLFEHLMFKGSAHLPDGLMDKLLEEAGGWSNATTSADATIYQNATASNFLEMMLWIEADRLAGLLDTFDKPKLDNQRDVVLNERREAIENQPYGISEILIAENLWPKGHGYHWSVIGYPADLKAATVADVSAFFKNYYVPNNATMVIAGDVKTADVKKLVEKYFGWIPKAPEPKRPAYKDPPPITKEIVIKTTDTVQVPKVFLTWRAPKKFTADEPALGIAAYILGEGKSSRLYKKLVYDLQIAQNVSASSTGEEIGGVFQIEISAKPGADPARLIKEATAEIAKLAADPPKPVEVERAQASHEAGFLTGIENTLKRAILLASYAVEARDPTYFAKDLARYRAVTPAQVKDAVATYLKPTARVQLTISPGKKVTK